MDFGSTDILLWLFALIVIGYIVAPLRRAQRILEPEATAQPDRLASLREEKEEIYREIKDLDFDFQTGKLSDADYETLSKNYRSRALAVLARLEEEEALAGSRDKRTGSGKPPDSRNGDKA